MVRNEWSFAPSSVVTLPSVDRDNSDLSFNGQGYSVLLYSMCHLHAVMCHLHAVISFRILLKMR